ncbi:hypothetical protein EMIT036CA2_20648 [Chryseobacterium sp. IT-36CA2]
MFVLRAAKKAGVKRVVLTSAFGAVSYGIWKNTPYTEEDWTVLNDSVAPYQSSKTISERTAWDFIQNEGYGMELSVVNPTTVMGPVLSNDYAYSIQLINTCLMQKCYYYKREGFIFYRMKLFKVHKNPENNIFRIGILIE